MFSLVVWWILRDVSEEITASIIRAINQSLKFQLENY
jgi:hypothetical protein